MLVHLQRVTSFLSIDVANSRKGSNNKRKKLNTYIKLNIYINKIKYIYNKKKGILIPVQEGKKNIFVKKTKHKVDRDSDKNENIYFLEYPATVTDKIKRRLRR